MLSKMHIEREMLPQINSHHVSLLSHEMEECRC